MGRPLTISLSLTAEHMARLERLAAHFGVSRSEMLRRLIDQGYTMPWPDYGRPLTAPPAEEPQP